MSVQPPPQNPNAGFNSSSFPGGSGQTVNFPKAQGTLTLAQGVVWGDGTFQNTFPGGGGGGGVNNPMTADLDGGGFSINNVDTFSGLFGNFSDVNTESINDSAAVQYHNMGPVVAGNEYVVALISSAADAEGSITIVSRCLDPGLRQTTVFTATAFRTRANANVIVNLTESDTPIFEALVIGERSGSLFCTLRCSAPSSTWEVRAYMNQDDKGTSGPYGDYWRVSSPSSIAPGLSTFVESRLGFQGEGQASMSGDLDVRDGIRSTTLICDEVTTNRVSTNELRDNGFGLVDTFAPLRMNNNDIQSANIIGANAYAAAALGAIVSVGTPSAGPLFVDSGNNRIGINVPNPQEDLEIDGNLQLDSNGANKIKFYDATATTERAEIDAVASGTGGQLVFYTKEDPGSVTAKMTIQADGRVTVSNRLEGLPPPVAGTDAANKDYVDASIPSVTGFVENPMIVDLDGGAFQINNIQDPTVAQDAATKNYVDLAIAAIPPAVPWVPYNLKWFNDSNQGITAPSASQWYDINNLSVNPINDGFVLGPAGSATFPADGVYMVRFSSTLGSASNGEFSAKTQILYTASGGFPTEGVCCEAHYVKKFSNTISQGGAVTCEGMVRVSAGDTVRPQIYYTSEPPGLVPQLGNNYVGTFNGGNTNDGTEFLIWKIGN